MFAAGVILFILGYGFIYTGATNLTTGGKGPTLFQAFGITASITLIDNTAVSPNLTGQPGTTAEPFQATQKPVYSI